MVNIFALFILAMIVIIVYRKLNNRYQETVFKTNLYELRDELRLLTIERNVDPYSNEFDYVDHSISKAIEISYYFTFFYIIFNQIKHDKAMKDIQEYRDRYDIYQEKIKNNIFLYQIDRKKNKFIHHYLIKQNYITRFFVLSLYKISFGITKSKFLFTKKIDAVKFLPETSDINMC
ncbi:MAG: hypothetical protein ABI091_27005 [Ferruginibacter sp.]